MKAVLNTCPWEEDLEVIDLPWKNETMSRVQALSCERGQQNGKLVFGVMNWDGNVHPHPPVQRALRLLVDVLEERGYEVRNLFQRIRADKH